MPRLVVILGSVTPPGRMRRALEGVCAARGSISAGLEAELIDLAGQRIAFADGRPPEALGDDTASIVARVGAADLVVLASPVYRASFSGALKNLLDHLPLEALCGKPVGIVAMGATPHHFLGVDSHLRDVLAWFGALVAPTSVYLCSGDFREGALVESARSDLEDLVRTLVKLHAIRPAEGESLGPRPLAARRG